MSGTPTFLAVTGLVGIRRVRTKVPMAGRTIRSVPGTGVPWFRLAARLRTGQRLNPIKEEARKL
jgi:hypothetical protein